jgi:predicted DNA-binding WGR domain protein
MTAVTLHRIDDRRNMSRFYRLDVQPDMFGRWLLVSEWGRIGRSGHMRVASFAGIDEAHAALQRRRRVKERRGYADTC